MKLFFVLKPCIAHITHHMLALHLTVILHTASEHAHMLLQKNYQELYLIEIHIEQVLTSQQK